MAQPRFNDDFTQADADRLCELAHLANEPQHRHHACLWETNGAVCNLHFHASEFPEHLRSGHGVVAPDRTIVVCRWYKCLEEIQVESIMRHVNEQHLELRHVCPICHHRFTRAYTVQVHVAEQHAG